MDHRDWHQHGRRHWWGGRDHDQDEHRERSSRGEDARFGEPGGRQGQYGGSDDRGGYGGGGRERVNYGGSGPANQYGSTYGRDDDREDFSAGRGGGYGQGGGYAQGQGGQDYPGTQYSGGGGAERWGGGRQDGRRDYRQDEQQGYDRGGGTYGERDFSQAARRSQLRDDQRYSGGAHQNQSNRQTGFSGYSEPDHHEPDYVNWKNSQLETHDRDYHAWRESQVKAWDEDYSKWRGERRSQFGQQFDAWRNQQKAQMTTSNTGETAANIGGHSNTDRDDERTKSTSSPGGAGKTETAPGGGAGTLGAGAAGGSSATYASGSGVPDQENNGASDAGVTTGSERAQSSH